MPGQVCFEVVGYLLEELRDADNLTTFNKDMQDANIFVGSLIFIEELADKVLHACWQRWDWVVQGQGLHLGQCIWTKGARSQQLWSVWAQGALPQQTLLRSSQDLPLTRPPVRGGRVCPASVGACLGRQLINRPGTGQQCGCRPAVVRSTRRQLRGLSTRWLTGPVLRRSWPWCSLRGTAWTPAWCSLPCPPSCASTSWAPSPWPSWARARWGKVRVWRSAVLVRGPVPCAGTAEVSV